RDLDRDLAVEAPAAVLAPQRSRLDHRADELLEVERVSLGPGEDPALELAREGVGTDQRGEELAIALATESLEDGLPGSVGQLAKRPLADAPDRMAPLRPRRPAHQ